VGQAVTQRLGQGTQRDPGLDPAVVGQIPGHQHHLSLGWIPAVGVGWFMFGWRGERLRQISRNGQWRKTSGDFG
jgi:hypothetical protein